MNISIHPMLRFNLNVIKEIREKLGDFNTSYVTVQPRYFYEGGVRSKISIHPMLRFNCLADFRKTQARCISIHPMLRFNGLVNFILGKYIEFQYILCYGSTLGQKRLLQWFDLISIHPMLRFNDCDVCSKLSGILFQYILCYGSTDGEFKKVFDNIQFQYILCYGSTS